MNIGSLGEQLTAKYLVDSGFELLRMNYGKKFGEIDVIVRRGDVVHFIEVKSVECHSEEQVLGQYADGMFMPELRVTNEKKYKLQKVFDDWIQVNAYDGVIQFDVAAVYIVPHKKIGYIKLFENVSL